VSDNDKRPDWLEDDEDQPAKKVLSDKEALEFALELRKKSKSGLVLYRTSSDSFGNVATEHHTPAGVPAPDFRGKWPYEQSFDSHGNATTVVNTPAGKEAPSIMDFNAFLREIDELGRVRKERTATDASMRWAKGEKERCAWAMFRCLEHVAISVYHPHGTMAIAVYEHLLPPRSDNRQQDDREKRLKSIQYFMHWTDEGRAKTRYNRADELHKRLAGCIPTLCSDPAFLDAVEEEVDPLAYTSRMLWKRPLEELGALMMLISAVGLLEYSCSLPALISEHFVDEHGSALSIDTVRLVLERLTADGEWLKKNADGILALFDDQNLLT